MNFYILLGLLSSVCTIVGLLTSDKFKSSKWKYATLIFVMTLTCGYAVHYNSEIERIKSIHKQAEKISRQYDPNSIQNNIFVHESLIFLEENRDRYPDAYKRAQYICSDMEKTEFQYDSEPAKKMYGIIKGIATMNQE